MMGIPIPGNQIFILKQAPGSILRCPVYSQTRLIINAVLKSAECSFIHCNKYSVNRCSTINYSANYFIMYYYTGHQYYIRFRIIHAYQEMIFWPYLLHTLSQEDMNWKMRWSAVS